MTQGDELVEEMLQGGSDRPSVWSVLAIRARKFVRVHARGVVAAIAALAVLGGAGFGWVRAHPAPLPVPGLHVQLVEMNAQADARPQPELMRRQLNLELVLRIQVTDRNAETIEFLGLTGPSISALPNAAAVVGSIEWTVTRAPAAIDCQRWQGGAAMKARMRLSRDGQVRELEAPVDVASDASALAYIDAQCDEDTKNHPLQVTGVEASLDPVSPVIHLVWKLENTTEVAWTLDSQLSIGSATSLLPLLPGIDEGGLGISIPAHGSAQARAQVRVTSCATPDEFQFTDQTIAVGAHAEVRGAVPDSLAITSSTIELPTDDTVTVIDLARQACVGAPTLAGALGTVSARVVNKQPSVRVAVTGLIEPARIWQVYLQQSSEVGADKYRTPFGAVMATSTTKGEVYFVATSELDFCDGQIVLSDELFTLIIIGAREYPFPIKDYFEPRTSTGECPVAITPGY